MVFDDALGPQLPVQDSTWWVVLLCALVLVQIGLMVFALRSLARTPTSTLTMPRYVWILLIVLLNFLGPIAYFVGGRKAVGIDG